MEILKNNKVTYGNYEVSERDYMPINTFGPYALFQFDNLNSNRFPETGLKAYVNCSWKAKQTYKGNWWNLNFGSLQFSLEGYIPVIRDRFTIIPQVYGSFLFGPGAENGMSISWSPNFQGPVPAYPCFNNLIGGVEMGKFIDHQIPFIGLNKMMFSFNNLAVLRADFRVRLFRRHFLTAMFNYARTGVDFMDVFKDDVPPKWDYYDDNAGNLWGCGLSYSINSKIGPIRFDVSSSSLSPTVNLYFSLGYYF